MLKRTVVTSLLLLTLATQAHSQVNVKSTVTESASSSSGSGDVVGPSSSVDNSIARFDGTTGKLLQGYTTNTPTIDDNGRISAIFTGFGSLVTTNGSVSWNTVQTPDTLVLATGSTSNNVVIAESADLAYDFAHALTTDPTLFINSHAQSSDQWISFSHNGTDGVINTGTGGLQIQGSSNALGLITFGDNGLFHYRITGDLSNRLMSFDLPVLSDGGYAFKQAGTVVAAIGASADGSTSNSVGGVTTLAGGRGSGTAAGGSVKLLTSPSIASGATLQTSVSRIEIPAQGKALTDATAVSLFEVALPTLTMAGGTIHACVQVTDGTDLQMLCQDVSYSAVNKAGAYTTDIEAAVNGATPLVTEQQGAKSVSAGTLVNTWTVVSGTNKVTIKLSSDTSLTPSGANSFVVYYTLINNSQQAITVL